MRTIAFYLPQFHPIPENDEWWGKGFTEWRNVAKARPRFRGHYQPHLPADLGFYDLRLPEVRDAQAQLAAQFGISGFCYYHYWFDGRRLLHRPFEEVLRSGAPAFPFCLCWANENWTRRWDGNDDLMLMPQKHSLDDDRRHIQHLLPAFADRRYIKIDGRPLFLVYRTGLLPEPQKTAAIWRQTARSAGFPDLYLARVESFGDFTDPGAIGFDAALEFAPDFGGLPPAAGHRWQRLVAIYQRLVNFGGPRIAYLEHRIRRYETLMHHMLAKPPAPYKRFRCVTPAWDNSARRPQSATIFRDSTPELYEEWLRAAARETRARYAGEERLLFINAWNEWAEGNHLEPDERWGLAYLEATERALRAADVGAPTPPCIRGSLHSPDLIP
jgi:lipopolysaccharide biosynthesis protein